MFPFFVLGGMSCDPRVMFKCRSSQGCLPRKLVCSGVKDCADGSDEWGCHADNHTGELIARHPFSFRLDILFGTSSKDDNHYCRKQIDAIFLFCLIQVRLVL